jgi:GntR family transcriptional regulator, carbon starvation induced regulator
MEPATVDASHPESPTLPSKTRDVLDQLRKDIVAGRWLPCERLPFRVLEDCYGVGLSPLREALCQLVGAGLVVLESQRGFRVADVSAEDFAHIVAIRDHVERFALREAIGRNAPAWRRQLEQAAGGFGEVAAKVGDQRPIDDAWERVHRQYHFALIDARHSPTLHLLCEQLYDKFDRYRRLAIPSQSYMAVPARDHQAMTRSALDGRADETEALLARHIGDIVEVMAANLPIARRTPEAA